MADQKKYAHTEHRKITVELDVRVPGASVRTPEDSRARWDAAVAEAVRRELQRTERR